jgi:hypothetical protein
MRYLLMLGFFREWIDVDGKKIPHPELDEAAINKQRTALTDQAWDWLAQNKGINRDEWMRARAPIPLACACSVCQCVISSALKGLRW